MTLLIIFTAILTSIVLHYEISLVKLILDQSLSIPKAHFGQLDKFVLDKEHRDDPALIILIVSRLLSEVLQLKVLEQSLNYDVEEVNLSFLLPHCL